MTARPAPARGVSRPKGVGMTTALGNSRSPSGKGSRGRSLHDLAQRQGREAPPTSICLPRPI